MTWIQIITLVIAVVGAICGVLGAVLGVINTLHQLGKDKVKLRVKPVCGYVARGAELSEASLGIEIVNLSGFPVTVCDAGFLRGDFLGKRVALIDPVILDGKPWPRRLEPHDSVTVYCAEGIERIPEMLVVTRCYARTTSGEVRYGTGPALRSFVDSKRKKQ